ncbi:MAG: sugar phosphate nucleotidyltransferase [Defluviitaleaceae bacterium]|nr:sugar phosphate nucleotidyltransferase [Defluviitaleaceae bacterium]
MIIITINPKKSNPKKAIIMAAGKGNRLLPLTATVPKPLIAVNGKIMIETLIESLLQNHITEIYIVTGHLSEKFSYLPKKYSTAKITLLFNPHYETSNNISSLYVAREHLGDCIIADGDFIINNPKIFAASGETFATSGYFSAWINETEETAEWLQAADSNGYVLSCSRNGGKSGWQLFSISFWNNEDGEKLRRHLEETFQRQAITDIYWDDIPMFLYKNDYRLKIKPINLTDLQEIDTLADLESLENLATANKQ